MDPDHVSTLIIEYRYWILIPLALLEGPLVAFIAGALAALGYFNIFALGIFFFVRDMAMDGLYYLVGFYGGRTMMAKRFLSKIGVQQDHLDEVRTLWEKHAGPTMFLGKLSYGIASSFIVVAGAVKMPLRKFFGWGAIVAITQFWTLLALGYFFGNSFGGKIESLLANIQYVFIAISIFIVLYYIGSRYAKKRFLKENKNIIT